MIPFGFPDKLVSDCALSISLFFFTVFITVFITGGCFLAACGGKEVEQTAARPVVAVSIAPQAFFIHRLAGNAVQPLILLPAGANHETFEPSISQSRALADARVYFTIGHPNFVFEQMVLKQVESNSQHLRIVNTSSKAQILKEDPHLWLSLENARAMAEIMAQALIDLLPPEKEKIEVNLARLLNDLEALDGHITDVLHRGQVRYFLVFHPSWGYFAETFHLEQLAIEVEGKEPTAAEIADKISRAKRYGLSRIYVEPRFSDVSACIIAAELHGAVVDIDPLAYDWLKNMSDVAEILAGVQNGRIHSCN